MIIGLDLGSSSVKAVPVDSRGRPRRSARRSIPTRRGPGGRVEQDGVEILEASIAVLRRAGAGGSAGDAGSASRGIPLGLATQRSTVLFWDRDTGRPLTPAYSWQDLRGRSLVAGGRSGGSGEPARAADFVAARTGLRLSRHYSVAKLAWALRHVPGLRDRVRRGRALWGTLGTFLLWNLSGRAFYAIDHANAQRTLLFNLQSLSWDPELFGHFGVDVLLDSPILPALVPTTLSSGFAAQVGRRLFRVLASTGDQQAALIGLGCRRVGDVAINYGSGAFVLQNVGDRPRRVPGLLTTLLSSAASEDRGGASALYAVEGTVNAAATAIDWAESRLRIRVRTAHLDRFLGPDDGRPRRVHFLPAVAGTGAPRWDESAGPRFAGDLAGSGPRDLLRAVIESIACRCAEIARAAGIARRGAAPILAAGGLTRCRSLLQAQADLLGRPILILSSPDATAVGAAFLAGASGDGGRRRPSRNDARRGGIEGRGSASLIVRPNLSLDEADRRFDAWRRAVYGPGESGVAGRAPGAARRGRRARS
jgi:glycerol kinase